MTISELITLLQKTQQTFGDLDVMLRNSEFGLANELYEHNISVEVEGNYRAVIFEE